MGQATVELPGATNDMCRCIYNWLKPVSDGVVNWSCGVFASCCCGSNCLLAHEMDGRISAAASVALASQLPLPRM